MSARQSVTPTQLASVEICPKNAVEPLHPDRHQKRLIKKGLKVHTRSERKTNFLTTLKKLVSVAIACLIASLIIFDTV